MKLSCNRWTYLFGQSLGPFVECPCFSFRDLTLVVLTGLFFLPLKKNEPAHMKGGYDLKMVSLKIWTNPHIFSPALVGGLIAVLKCESSLAQVFLCSKL